MLTDPIVGDAYALTVNAGLVAEFVKPRLSVTVTVAVLDPAVFNKPEVALFEVVLIVSPLTVIE